MTDHICTLESCPVDGSYYVSCVDSNGHLFLMAGPYQNHAEALANQNKALMIADNIDGRAWFMKWGTVRVKDGTRKPGRLNMCGRI
jgi:hypothetical protein